jgi:ABC-type branched-subunit amino acid transport system substrate-binding protein
MEQQPFDTWEKQLRELGNVPVPDVLLKNIQARLGQLTPQWAGRQYYLGRQLHHRNKEAYEQRLLMALGHFQNALHVYTAEAFPSQRVKVLCASGRAYRELGDLSEKDRLTYLARAVTCYKEARQIEGVLRLSSRLLARLDQVIRACYQQRIQELKHCADVEKTMADFLRLTDQRVSALANYHQALRLYRLVESRLDEAIVLKDLGDVHASLQRLDAAMQHYHQALACFRQMDHRHDVATVLQAMGDAALSRHEEAGAEGYYREALALFRQVGDNFSEAAVRTSLGMQVEEVDLYRKVGETNISHMQFGSFDRHVAVLERPVHDKTTGGVRGEASPEFEEPLIAMRPFPAAPGALKQRKEAKWVLLVLLLFLIVTSTAFWKAGLWYRAPALSPSSQHSCVSAAGRFSDSGIGAVRTAAGECTGLSDGRVVFDIDQPGRSDSTLKQQAAAALARGERGKAEALFQQAVKQDKSDAEALIYLEDLQVLQSGRSFITFVVGTKITGDRIGLTGERRILQGAYLAQQAHNRTCRDGCLLIRLLIANTGNDAHNAGAVANQIVQAAHADPSIVGVEGWSVSQDTFNIAKTFQNAHIPMVSAVASSDWLTNISPYFFRVAPPDSSQGTLAASYVVNNLHVQRIALLVDFSNAYSTSLAAAFIQHATSGDIKEFPYTVGTYARDTKLLQADLHEIANDRPDLIYFAGYSEDARALFQELSREQRLALLPVMGGDALYNLVGDPDQSVPGLDHLFFTAFASPDEWQYFGRSGKKPLFFQDYARIFASGTSSSAPTGNVILAYDALQVLIQAAHTAFASTKTSLTGQDIQQALQKITGSHAWQGVSGQITLGPDGNPQEKTVVMLHVNQDGTTGILDASGNFLRK